MQNIFFDIGLMVIIASFGAYLSRLIKQPLIPAYLIAGALITFIGPIFTHIPNSEVILTLSEIGIAFLLFMVGLELDFKKLKDIGLVATVGGTLQTFIVFIFAFFIGELLGFIRLEAIYIGLIVAFSSTMVVIKLLADKKELGTLHGRIVIGILLMQDILAIFIISLLVNANHSGISLVISFIKAGIIIVVALLSGKYVFPALFKYAARSSEVLFLSALSICFLFALLFSYIGFSIIIGAFVAGVALASLPYNIEMISMIRSLRDFFATIFFVSLGMQLLFTNIVKIILPLIILTVVVILIKPLVIMIISSFFRYTKRTSFLTSISLAQVSEFSMIIVAIGLSSGHISPNIFSLSILLAIATIAVTSYLIKFDYWLYEKIAKYLDIFDVIGASQELQYLPSDAEYDIILCGYDRIGYSIFEKIKKMKKSFVVVDFNPDIIKRLVKRKINCIYGDIGDLEILERLNLDKVELVVSTVPRAEQNLLLIKKTKAKNKKAVIFVTADDTEDALKLYEEGADYVILPHFLGGDHVSLLVESFTKDIDKLLKNKFEHISELKKRKELGHGHPRKG